MSAEEIGIPSVEDVRTQLERIRRSKRFARTNRAFPFLQFLVDGAFEGKEFTEEEIARDLFHVGDDWAPLLDANVRVTRFNLQKYLGEYYEDEGAGDPIVIEVPSGTVYRVVYRFSSKILDENHYRLGLAAFGEMLIHFWPLLARLRDRKDLEEVLEELKASGRVSRLNSGS
jgi:hypothetical protein